MPKRRHTRILALAGLLATLAVLVVASTAWVDSGPNFEPLSAAAGSAVRSVEDESRASCLGKSQITELLAAELAAAGDTRPYTVRADGGVQYPVGERDEVLAHIKNGCYIYSAVGYDASGKRVYYIAGPESLAEPTPTPR